MVYRKKKKCSTKLVRSRGPTIHGRAQILENCCRHNAHLRGQNSKMSTVGFHCSWLLMFSLLSALFLRCFLSYLVGRSSIFPRFLFLPHCYCYPFCSIKLVKCQNVQQIIPENGVVTTQIWCSNHDPDLRNQKLQIRCDFQLDPGSTSTPRAASQVHWRSAARCAHH